MACIRFVTNTPEAWTSENPRLSNGEMGIEVDAETGEFGQAKLGNASRPRWNDLEYWSPASEIIAPSAFVDDPTGAATDTDDEARAAIIAIRDVLIAQGLMEAEE